METDILKNKSKLIQKKHEKFTVEVVNTLTPGEAGIQLKLLDEAFSKYNVTYDEELTITTEKDIDQLIEDFEKVSDLYMKVKCRLACRVASDGFTHGQNGSTTAALVENTQQQFIKLPPINIPTFDGNYNEWYPFKDQFVSIIHKNINIDDTRKMHYLKSSLKGSAAHVIESMATIGENYNEAWTLVQNRYDNERLIVQSHVYQLLTQPQSSNESTNVLKTLLDNTNKHLRALSVQKQPVEKWDAIIIGIVVTRLPHDVRKAWELESATYLGLPTWEQLQQFMEYRIQALNMLQYKPSNTNYVKVKQINKTITAHLGTDGKNNIPCSICTQQHSIYKCNTFMTATPSNRLDMVKRTKLCFNCLRSSHSVNQCSLDKTCKTCGSKHHTLLHLDVTSTTKPSNTSEDNESKTPTTSSTVSHLGATGTDNHNIILSTAQVQVCGDNGRTILCRALLDSGSQSHFVTTSLVAKLGTKKTKTRVTVSGISTSSTTIKEEVIVTIKSCINNKQFQITALVAPCITIDMPTSKLDTSTWSHIQGVSLADPTFHQPGKIDMLIGAELFFNIIQDGKQYGPRGTPVLQNSIFGWIIAGRSTTILTDKKPVSTNVITCCAIHQPLEDMVENFWKIEEVPRLTIMSKEDSQCEEHFLQTHTRLENGRYEVRLPFKETPPTENNSLELAIRRLEQVERALVKKPDIYQQYKEFINEYLNQNHMELVQPGEKSPTIFLPHHHVARPDSVTTKLRVVFDGSSKVNNYKSLNDMLYRGHKLQRDMVRVLTRFRLPLYVYTADIRQMFRQIKVHPDDCQYQGIVWRDNPSEPIRFYRLNTVTYGLITSPFHALRTLQQLAIDEQINHPIASTVLQNDFYVDEVMAGCDSLRDAQNQIQDLIALLHQGCFDLRKWASNSSTLLETIPPEKQVLQMSMTEQTNDAVSVLGILWNTKRDTFSFKVKPMNNIERLTKRELLSEIARTYDPCGWLAPLVIVAKIFMQRLWQKGKSWDEPVDDELLNQWIVHRRSYEHLLMFEIPRHIGNIQNNEHVYHLHGFSDSSECAYAAAVYVVTSSGAHLLMSKTRVAPLKKVTIPRLELCGAVLLTQLADSIIKSIGIKFDSVNMWTDSTVTLQWIHSDANKWNTFVSNRVTLIQGLLSTAQWRHVRSADNPADLASRGISGDQLVDNLLWWHGPTWLHNPEIWPVLDIFNITSSTISEEKRTPSAVSLSINIEPVGQILLTQCSNYERINRIGSYILRFCYNLLHRDQHTTGQITVAERRRAIQFWIRTAQQADFKKELGQLQSGKAVSTKSVLSNLNPFLDHKGMLRVGGRLKKADITDDQKYPIILPKSHVYTHLLIKQIHSYYLHASLEITLSVLRQKYWVIHCRSTVKKILHCCIICARTRKVPCQQLMADLPASRVTITHPFARVGIDYAGPINTKPVGVRARTTTKSYLVMFVCFTTKAVHLDIVSSLSTNEFIATLKRFVSRRGYPTDIYSDNGTNFVGANNKLRALHQFLTSNISKESIKAYCVPLEINWHFNPPASPHHGGLWEANIKSTKTILYRHMGKVTLSFEELSTVCCQIEAILNSRPLCALENGTALTPGHFLVGRSLLAVPEHEVVDTPINRLKRWDLVQRITQSYWKSWSSTYLCSLQQRPKWRKLQENLAPGDIVILRETGTASTQWPMAQVIEILPNSSDQQVRVVRIRTPTTELTRPITKLVKLPVNEN